MCRQGEGSESVRKVSASVRHEACYRRSDEKRETGEFRDKSPRDTRVSSDETSTQDSGVPCLSLAVEVSEARYSPLPFHCPQVLYVSELQQVPDVG